jgi:hypothetical protein
VGSKSSGGSGFADCLDTIQQMDAGIADCRQHLRAVALANAAAVFSQPCM